MVIIVAVLFIIVIALLVLNRKSTKYNLLISFLEYDHCIFDLNVRFIIVVVLV